MSKRMSKSLDIATRIPWVTRLDEPAPGGCIGFKGNTPLKAIFQWGPKDDPNPPVGLGAYRCKNPARWHFEALPPEDDFAVDTGNYCWSHLLHRGLYGSHEETQRTEAWLEEQGIA